MCLAFLGGVMRSSPSDALVVSVVEHHRVSVENCVYIHSYSQLREEGRTLSAFGIRYVVKDLR